LINIIFIFDIIFKVLDEWASESRVGMELAGGVKIA
jgi:hypothetical protein